jgi:hypothetical protein
MEYLVWELEGKVSKLSMMAFAAILEGIYYMEKYLDLSIFGRPGDGSAGLQEEVRPELWQSHNLGPSLKQRLHHPYSNAASGFVM